MVSRSNPLKSVLVANRGEIALRIVKTARAMGLRTVAVYSEADADAPHVRAADDARYLGPSPVAESYLSIPSVLDAARAAQVDAVHPGYGFLSENADFVRAVEDAGLVFIGPSAGAVEIMGDKAKAKRRMVAAGVPCLPGYEGDDQSDHRLATAADQIGFPVMVKAAAGGGGRGMRRVEHHVELADALTLARAEGKNAFGSDKLIIEKAVTKARHVEIQVMADAYGHTIHLGERDCSVQRRHQKLIEEAPSPALSSELRQRMGAAAVTAARAVDYRNAGTVEFLLDGDESFYFLEMNTRLQVEHPTTEMVTGLDLVELQIRIASGEPLTIRQSDVRLEGSAIEARLYAENPSQDFRPSTGPVRLWLPPPTGPGIRVDSGTRTGCTISPHYDAMLAKVVAHGGDRDEARRRLICALDQAVLFGVSTNRDFLIRCLRSEVFARGHATTCFIEEVFGEAGTAEPPPSPEILAIGAVAQHVFDREDAAHRSVGVHPELLEWSSSGPLMSVVTYRVDGTTVMIRVESRDVDRFVAHVDDVCVKLRVIHRQGARWRVETDGGVRSPIIHRHGMRCLDIAVEGRSCTVQDLTALRTDADSAGSGLVTAPMHGKLTQVLVTVGQTVSAGDRLAVLEAMKMHLEIMAEIAGRVSGIVAAPGDQLAAHDPIMELDPC